MWLILYSEEFKDVFFENMVESDNNGGMLRTIKVLQREILTSFFAVRTAHRSAIATELYNREAECHRAISWSWAAVLANRSQI